MKSGFTSTWVEAQGHRKPYPGAPVTIPPVVTSESEVQHRRIVPTPVSIPVTPIPTPSEMFKIFRERDARMEQEIQQRAAQMKAEREQRIET